MARKEKVATLDVGTSKICALIAEVDENEKVEVLGLGLSPSLGIKKGVVVDIENNSRAISQAVKRAEQMAGTRMDEVWVGVAGPHISSQNSHGMVAVTGEKKEIKPTDINRVIEASRIISLPPEREVLHVLPREFLVDGNAGIKDPQGMSGARLEVHTHIVTASSASLENLIKSVEKSDLEVKSLVLELIAISNVVLTPDEKELGVVLVDIGGGTTDIAIYREGGLVFTKILPIGGSYVTNDIAVGLRTAVKSAEEIKVRYGAARQDKDCQEEIKVMSASGKEERLVPRTLLLEIIEPRMIEILSMVKKEIEESGYNGMTPAGAVFTGGASLLRGAVDLASDVLELPVRLGQPERLKGLNELGEGASREAGLSYVFQAPVFSTVAGLVNYSTSNRERVIFTDTIRDYFKKLTDRLKDTF